MKPHTTADAWDKLGDQAGADAFALFRTRLIGWCLEKSRRYRQALLRTGRYSNMKYLPEIDISSSSDTDKDKASTPSKNQSDKPKSTEADSLAMDAEIKEQRADEARKKQMKYNRICEKIWGKILNKLGEGATAKLMNRQPPVEEGDGPTAFEYLQAIYHGTEVRSLSSLFIQLVAHVSMDTAGGYEAYLSTFRLTLRSIDLNPGMENYKGINGNLHSLPNELLVALFLNGLSEEFQDTESAINDDIAKGQKVQLTEVYKRCTAKFNSLERIAGGNNSNMVEGKNFPKRTSTGNGNPATKADAKSKDICRNFMRHGTCRYGDECKFRHEQPPKESAFFSEHIVNTVMKKLENKFRSRNFRENVPDVEGKEGTRSGSNGTGMGSPPPRAFYAVYNGKDGYTGVLSSWSECHPKVKKKDGTVRPGVTWRKFKRKSDAEGFLYEKAAGDNSSESHMACHFSGYSHNSKNIPALPVRLYFELLLKF